MNKLDLKQGRQLYLMGLTGNIACGKSAVLRMLRERGAYTIDADTISHKIQQPGGTAYEPILEAFGPQILADPASEAGLRPIDRRKLGAIVFADPVRLRELELIMHPLVRLDLMRQVTEASQQVVVLDAIKLLENNLDQACDAVWVVTCQPQVQLERLIKRNNFTPEEALLRIEAQTPQSDKVARADVVIDNSGSLEATARQVENAWRGIKLD